MVHPSYEEYGVDARLGVWLSRRDIYLVRIPCRIPMRSNLIDQVTITSP